MVSGMYIWRSVLIAVIMLASLSGLGARLAFLHLSENLKLQSRISDMRYSEREILVGRGRIFDRTGKLMAIDLPVKDVILDPLRVQEAGVTRFVSGHLARLLEVRHEEVLQRARKQGRRYERVKRFVPLDEVEEVARLKLPGVYFEDASKRIYPQNELMCHVVGYANWSGVGSAGIEQRMNRYLKGRPGLLVSEKDGNRRELYDRRSLEIPAQAGADVHLTLDQNLQFLLEEAMDKAMEEHHAKGAWAVMQDVRSGEILAMVSRPGFDLNTYMKFEKEELRNRAIGYVYEPGSTFKLMVIAAALNEGVVNKDTVFNCENGSWYYKGKPLRDYHGYSSLTVADILKKSSNIGAAKIAIALNPRRTEEYLRDFGIGKVTGIELPGEEYGLFRSRDSWTGISITRIAMGHEVAVTALQIVNAVNAIANNGFLMKPTVIRKIVNADGLEVLRNEPEVLARPISEETSRLMRTLMTRVTETGGTGRKARFAGYEVAGKTGTAQKPMRGGYSDSANIASFVGFVPAQNPEFTMIVVVDEPQPLHTGGSVAAPVFREVAEQAVRYLDIPAEGRVPEAVADLAANNRMPER